MRITENQRVPFGWSVAWHDYATMSAVVLPMGMHLIAGRIRSLYLTIAIATGARATTFDRAVQRARAQGETDGYARGYKTAVQHCIVLGKQAEEAAIRKLLAEARIASKER